MKTIAIPCLLLLTLLLSSYKKNENGVPLTKIQVQAPFSIPEITVPDFGTCKTFSIVDFGAVLGDKQKNSLAIAKAISAASEAGVELWKLLQENGLPVRYILKAMSICT